jgi:hypothetical protein
MEHRPPSTLADPVTDLIVTVVSLVTAADPFPGRGNGPPDRAHLNTAVGTTGSVRRVPAADWPVPRAATCGRSSPGNEDIRLECVRRANHAGIRPLPRQARPQSRRARRLYILRRVQTAAEHSDEKLPGLVASFTEKTEFESASGEDRRPPRSLPGLASPYNSPTPSQPLGSAGRRHTWEYSMAAPASEPDMGAVDPVAAIRRFCRSITAACTPSTRQTTAPKWWSTSARRSSTHCSSASTSYAA